MRQLQRIGGLAALLITAASTALSAQFHAPAVRAGSYMRVTTEATPPRTFAGRLVWLSADSVIVLADPPRGLDPTREALPRTAVRLLEVDRTNRGKGLSIGALIGFAAGFMLGSTAEAEDTPSFAPSLSSIAAPMLGITGALVGGVAGFIVAPTRWEPVR